MVIKEGKNAGPSCPIFHRELMPVGDQRALVSIMSPPVVARVEPCVAV